LALIENLQREDLNSVEEAMGYKALMDDFNLTQEEVAAKVSKSRSAVANALRLLNLNDDESDALRRGLISAGHARALLSCTDEEIRANMLAAALEGASVRDLEKMSKIVKNSANSKKKPRSTFYNEVELALKQEMRRKVSIKETGKGKGTLTIEFFSDDELKEFANRLSENK